MHLRPHRSCRPYTLFPATTLCRSNLVAIRSASTVGDIVVVGALIGGDAAAASGSMDSDDSYFFKGIRIIAINAATKKFLGSVTIDDLNESRKMAVLEQPAGTHGLYLGVSSSERRRVGKGCVSTCISRWVPDHSKKQR